MLENLLSSLMGRKWITPKVSFDQFTSRSDEMRPVFKSLLSQPEPQPATPLSCPKMFHRGRLTSPLAVSQHLKVWAQSPE